MSKSKMTDDGKGKEGKEKAAGEAGGRQKKAKQQSRDSGRKYGPNALGWEDRGK